MRTFDPRPYAKSVVGFIAPGATALIAAVTPGSPGGEGITQGEGITALCVCVVTAAAVYATRNSKPATPKEE